MRRRGSKHHHVAGIELRHDPIGRMPPQMSLQRGVIGGVRSARSVGRLRGFFDAQFRRVVQNLADVLKGLGTDYKGVVKFTTYLTRSEDIERFMILRAELFPKLFGSAPYPPNTLLIVSRLVKPEFLIELEAVALVGR